MELVLDVILYWPIALLANYSTFLQQRMRGRHKQYPSLPPVEGREKTFLPMATTAVDPSTRPWRRDSCSLLLFKASAAAAKFELLRSELLTPRLRVDAKPPFPPPLPCCEPKPASRRFPTPCIPEISTLGCEPNAVGDRGLALRGQIDMAHSANRGLRL